MLYLELFVLQSKGVHLLGPGAQFCGESLAVTL